MKAQIKEFLKLFETVMDLKALSSLVTEQFTIRKRFFLPLFEGPAKFYFSLIFKPAEWAIGYNIIRVCTKYGRLNEWRKKRVRRMNAFPPLFKLEMVY